MRRNKAKRKADRAARRHSCKLFAEQVKMNHPDILDHFNKPAHARTLRERLSIEWFYIKAMVRDLFFICYPSKGDTDK
jgi:hypothetical protein